MRPEMAAHGVLREPRESADEGRRKLEGRTREGEARSAMEAEGRRRDRLKVTRLWRPKVGGARGRSAARNVESRSAMESEGRRREACVVRHKLGRRGLGRDQRKLWHRRRRPRLDIGASR
ncbi:hypothetical protein U1Q18_014321 [Sarracenia purpurea var. burkii]